MYVNQKTKLRRIIQVLSTHALKIIRFAETHRETCKEDLEPSPLSLWAYTGGVHINGKKWRTGTPFFYHLGDPAGRKNFGTVRKMYHWQDHFATTLIIEVERYTLHDDSLLFWVDPVPDLAPRLIYWNQVTWRCHMSDTVRDGRPMKSVVRVSTTQPTMDGIDFDGYM